MQPHHLDQFQLCQVSDQVSCGACCGLYNMPNLSRERLAARLAERTADFDQVPRQPNDIMAFGENIEAEINHQKPLPDFYHCPFIGLIGAHHERVGCLLHPLSHGNGYFDFRDLCHYGGMACRIYYCPSHLRLSLTAANAVRLAFDDWYEYGMVITETSLIMTLFETLAAQLNNPRWKQDLLLNPVALSALRRFLSLKLAWPYRDPQTEPIHYFFNDQLYPRPPVKYPEMKAAAAAYDLFFREFGSVFNTAADLQQAERMIADGMAEIVRELEYK